jgi:hypothetical protein
MSSVSAPSHQPLFLLAMDSEDLSIVSAHMQNAVVRIGEMAYLPAEQRFVLMAARYDWLAAPQQAQRVRAGLHFDHVTRVTQSGVDQNAPQQALNLQSLLFKPFSGEGQQPTGHILLAFQSGATVRLDVECIEAQMRDIGPHWPSAHPPEAGIDDRPADVN